MRLVNGKIRLSKKDIAYLHKHPEVTCIDLLSFAIKHVNGVSETLTVECGNLYYLVYRDYMYLCPDEVFETTISAETLCNGSMECWSTFVKDTDLCWCGSAARWFDEQ